MEALASPAQRCKICDLPFNKGETWCRNPICDFEDRWFNWNFAVAMRSGALEQAINRYKYEGRRGWGLIFGRIIAGFLEEQSDTFRDFNLIAASPTWTGQGGRTFDHTRDVVERASAEVPPASGWTFDDMGDPVLVKTAETPRMVGKGFKERWKIAEGPLRESLSVVHPERVAGRRILVYDDVFTDGLTLREVARALIADGGAAEVSGVTLCRQPFRPRSAAN